MIGQYVTIHGDVVSHVNISQVLVEDGGEYSCVGENRAGKIVHSARLNIYGNNPIGSSLALFRPSRFYSLYRNNEKNKINNKFFSHPKTYRSPIYSLNTKSNSSSW